jgi:hypothetical protein
VDRSIILEKLAMARRQVARVSSTLSGSDALFSGWKMMDTMRQRQGDCWCSLKKRKTCTLPTGTGSNATLHGPLDRPRDNTVRQRAPLRRGCKV